jgi:tetratricopeptide (TPR) repeat protein
MLDSAVTSRNSPLPRKYGTAMKKRLRVIILALEIFLVPVCSPLMPAQISEARNTKSKSTHVNHAIINGIELIYDWKFDEAENVFNKIVAEKPKDPAGYFYLAMVTWSRLASGFWSSEMVEQYGERIDRAIFIANKKIKEDKADAFTYFYLGGALGFKGRFQLMQQKWLSSFFHALEAIKALETCQKMDPDNKDVLLGLGIFDYYTARLSGVLKFLSYLLIHEGNKEEGLRKLHVAAEEAIYSSVEAKSLLLHIYLFLEDGHYTEALVLAQELAQSFDQAPRNKYLEGVACIRIGDENKYREVLDCLKNRASHEDSRHYAAIWGRRVQYLEATHCLVRRQMDRARSKLDIILSQPDAKMDPLMLAWPLLKKGMSYDIEGNREEAIKYYRKILRLKNGAGAQFLAQRYLDEPAQREDPFLAY